MALRTKKKPCQRERVVCSHAFFDLPLPRSLLLPPHLFRSRTHGGEAHAGDTPSELARRATGLFLEKRVIKKKEKKR